MAGLAQGQTLLSLGASSGSSGSCNLSGGGVCTLSARVTGLSPATVTFDFSPTVAGAVIGNPSGPNSTGLTTITYTAPNPILSRQTVTVSATASDGTRASTVITLVPPTVTVQVTPATVTLTAGASQHFTANVFGVSQTGVTWSISPQLGSIDASGNYTAPSPITATQKVTVTATSVFDPSVSGSASVQLNTPTISISPATASLNNGQSVQFTATVANAETQDVTWSINPQVGSISPAGVYTAPSLLTATQKVTVTATSISDTTKSATATVTLTPLYLVGIGAPTPAVEAAFQGAYNRNGFNALIVGAPLGNVKGFGNTGYVQEFTDAANTSLKDALITGAASLGGTNAVFQIMAPLYAYYTSIGANTAGYPLGDSQTCSAQNVSCVWDTFDKNYALFSYVTTLASGQNFNVNGTFFTEWTALGGFATLGSPVSAQTANITATPIAPATTGTTATVQTFAKGAIYSITSGASRGKIYAITQPIYSLYIAQQGPAGTLGMPTSELFQIAAGVYKQTFEGGALQYTSGGDPTVVLPVAAIRLDGAVAGTTITLNVGQSVTLTATPVITNGADAPDRPVSWTSTNGKVLSIQATGGTAVVSAIAGGAASVQAASQGISSARISFIVISPCCQVGDGAPASVQQAFQDALTRNKIVVQPPLPAPAARVGGGYVQMLQSPDSNTTYMLAQSDRLGTAYVVSGGILARYQALGGPAGTLGYPASDASAGGTQLFANGAALGGSPVRLVQAPILAKWALLGYDSGAAGLPAGEAVPFSTLGANSGQQQAFTKGTILGASTGPRAGQAYFVSGLILARYNALGGASGDFGMPASDEFSNGGLRQQNFEGGNLTYAAGDTAAVEHAAPRVPAVIASPASVSAGGRARLAVVGFPNNSTLRVSLTGSPDFTVTPANGAYSWDMAIPLTAKSGSIAIHAVDGKGAVADGTLSVKGFADNRIQIAKLQGDNQSGLPGSALPLTVRVGLVDVSNNPVVGAPVTFTPSAGLQLSAASMLSDGAGQAEVLVRLPSSEGIAAITVTAGSIAQVPVTFYVRAAGGGLTNVPKLVQAGDSPLGNGTATIAQKGALLTSVASILRYHQNRGELRSPNGAADPVSLNQFLTQYCVVDTKGATLCDGYLSAGPGAEQIVNLWRAAEFTGGADVAVQPPTVAAAADVLAQGSPALLSLALSRNGVPAGGHFVVATGVAADGSLLIQDPSPYFARTSLADYLNGFATADGAWTAELRGVVQFALRSPSATRFLVGALSQQPDLMKTLAIDIQSAAGACGAPLELVDGVDAAGNASGGLVSRLRACDGAQPAYQVSVGAARPFRAFLTDLATAGSSIDLSGSAPASYKVTRTKLNVVLAPQDTAFTADAVVSAATFGPGISPGGIFSIFGTGLAGSGTATTVDFDGTPATVFLASAFQVNAMVPASIVPGSHILTVRSPFGTARQTVTVSATSSGIFLIGNPPMGAIVNQDGSLNSPSAPLPRGQYMVIYATGLGAVTRQGNFSVAATPVTVVLNGQDLPVLFAGLTPGSPGLYQVNVVVPAATPPGLGLTLALKQAGQLSNVVTVAVQ